MFVSSPVSLLVLVMSSNFTPPASHRARQSCQPGHQPERAEVRQRADHLPCSSFPVCRNCGRTITRISSGLRHIRDPAAQHARQRLLLPRRWTRRMARLAREPVARCSALHLAVQERRVSQLRPWTRDQRRQLQRGSYYCSFTVTTLFK